MCLVVVLVSGLPSSKAKGDDAATPFLWVGNNARFAPENVVAAAPVSERDTLSMTVAAGAGTASGDKASTWNCWYMGKSWACKASNASTFVQRRMAELSSVKSEETLEMW